MGMGIAGLMRGAGAGEGLQTLLKQRLMEREMALREQAQRASEQQHAAELSLRTNELDENRRYRQGVDAQMADFREGQQIGQAAREVPYGAVLPVETAVKFKARGYPVVGPSQDELNSPMANEEIPDYQYAGNAPAPRPSKLMTPEEMAQWKEQKKYEALVTAQNRPPSSEAAGSWSDTGRTNAKGEAIYVNTKTLEQRTMPFGAKQSPGAEQESERKRLSVLDSANETLNVIDELLDENGRLRPEVLPAIGSSRMMGVQFVPGTDAYNAQATIDRLRARMVTDLMGKLKSQSRTGATGFGQLSEKELKVLQDSAAKLDPGQGEGVFQTELQNIRRRIELLLKDGGNPTPGGGSRYEVVK